MSNVSANRPILNGKDFTLAQKHLHFTKQRLWLVATATVSFGKYE